MELKFNDWLRTKDGIKQATINLCVSGLFDVDPMEMIIDCLVGCPCVYGFETTEKCEDYKSCKECYASATYKDTSFVTPFYGEDPIRDYTE